MSRSHHSLLMLVTLALTSENPRGHDLAHCREAGQPGQPGADTSILCVETSLRINVRFDFKRNHSVRLTCVSQFSDLDNVLLLELYNLTYPRYNPKVIIRDCPPPVLSYSHVLSSLAIDLATIESLDVINISPNVNNIQSKYFENLPKLNELNLRSCGLKTLTNTFIRGIGNISYFSAQKNELTEVPRNLLKDTRITELDLSQNNLSTLPEKLFKDNNEIRLLNLSRNHIDILPSLLFSGLEDLLVLDLSHNLIKSIGEKLFGDTINLRMLDMSFNHLENNISKLIFRKTHYLEELILSNNRLSSRDTECLKHQNLQHVRKIDLSFNKIHLINFKFLFMSKLQTLNLSHNALGPILSTEDIDFKLTFGLSVDLSHNKIERLKFIHRNGTETSNENFLLNLSGNPIICDCEATDLKRKLMKEDSGSYHHRMFKVTEDALICGNNSFRDNAGKSIKNLQYRDLNCPLLQSQCSESCHCSWNKYHKQTLVDCSLCSLSSIPKISMGSNQNDNIILNLSGNSLLDLAQLLNDPSYEFITELDLSHNNLRDVDMEKMPLGLRLLYLDHNNLTTMSNNDVTALDNLVTRNSLKLKLGHNRFLCDCDSELLYRFLINRKQHVEDVEEVRLDCHDKLHVSHVSLVDVSLHQFCRPQPQHFARVLSLLLAILLVISLLLCVSACYRDSLQIWAYSQPWARILFSEDMRDKEKPYDAFISYSQADSEYVETSLLPGLEQPEDPGDKFKCLIHTRDWNVGEMIPDQIIHSVESSRRTIIVLSKSYIDSMWTKLEFRAAHKQALQDRTRRVILIVIGSLPDLDSLDDDLRRYIKTNTYLDSRDPWFRQKLR